MLELTDITKQYAVQQGALGRRGGTVKAVDGVSLKFAKAETFGLVGESGCGKTTLARILMRLIPASSGKIIFDGQDMTKAKGAILKKFRANVQMVFQDPYASLDPRYSIRRILYEPMPLIAHQLKSQAEREKRIVDLISAVELDPDVLTRYPHELSGGERQRIAIARALVVHPKFLVLDEAVSSLDVIVQDQILRLLTDLQKRFNLTFLFISHNLRVVKRVCRKTAVMYDGRIVELAATEELMESPLHPYTRNLLNAAIHYSSNDTEAFSIQPDHHLKEQKDGHFVLG